jgi:flagellar motor switch protein FliG
MATTAATQPTSPGAEGRASRGGLSGREKAAILLLALGPDAAAKVFQHLDEPEIEQLTLQLASLGQVDPETEAAVVEECRQTVLARQYVEQGGVRYAREVLEKALGPGRAAAVLERLTATLTVRPFEFARRADPAQLLTFLQQEHPQTIALILAHLNPEQAAAILAALDPERQTDVTRRLAQMDATSPDILREVERVLERSFATLAGSGQSRVGGIEMAVQVLNRAGRATEKRILHALETEDPALAQELRRRMFVFEDLARLDDRSLQRALREVDTANDLPLALKVASPEVRAKIMKNISKRQAEVLQESLELLGPVRLREVEDAQQRIVAVVRRLEDEGEILISRGGEDDVVV